MTLNPPTDEQVENYKILYDQSYWGNGEIQVSFSDGPASEQTSKSLPLSQRHHHVHTCPRPPTNPPRTDSFPQ